MKIVKESIINEGYGIGAGLSYTGGVRGMSGSFSRGGFGGASNLGGPNLSYSYEIKPLNHTLEPRPSNTYNVPQIQIGSKVSGNTVWSNAYPDGKKVTGIVRKIALSNGGAVKYYVIQDEENQTYVKIDPLTAKLIIAEPVQYYNQATDTLPSRRKQKLDTEKKKLVRESIC